MHRRLWLLSTILISIGAFAQNIHYSYDQLGRVVGVVDQNGNAAQYVYDADGNVISIIRYSSEQVAVLSFRPVSGPPGTTVTIEGANFSSTASQDSVSFNGAAAQITSATSTEIVAIVPSGAISGPISVTAPLGSAASLSPFTVTSTTNGVPTISGLAPTIAAAGDTVMLSGTNFFPSPSNDIVSVNGYTASVTAVQSGNSLSFTTPSVGSGNVTLLTPSGSATSSQILYIPPSPYTADQVGSTQAITPGTPLSTSISTAGNVGLITFTGTAGQLLSLTLADSNFPDPCQWCAPVNVAVLNPDGSTLASTSIAWNATTGFLDSVQLTLSGTYTIAIEPQGSSTGSLTTTLFLFNDQTGTIAPSDSLPGNPLTVTTNTPGQNALLTFSGTAGQQVSLTLANSTFPVPCGYCSPVVANILNPDGTTLASTSINFNSTTAFIDSTTLPQTGTYTLEIDPQGGTTGSVDANLFLFNDQTGTIVPSASLPGNLITATTNTPGQNVLLTFSGTAGQQMSLTLANSTFPDPCAYCSTLVANILNPDGTTLASTSVNFNSSTAFIDSTILPQTGTYTVEIDPQGGTTGSVDANLFLFNDQTGTIVPSASLPGNLITATTNTPGQNVLLTFSGTAGQQMSLTLANSTFPDPCAYCSTLVANILNPDGTTLGSTSVNFNSSTAFIDSTILPQTGTYTVELDPQGSSTGSVDANLFLFNDQTGPITPGTLAAISTSTPGQNIFLTFSETAGQQVSLMLDSSTFPDPCAYCNTLVANILNPDGTVLASTSVNFNSSTASIAPTTLTQTGTYTLELDPQGSSTGSANVTVETSVAPPTFSLQSGSYSTPQSVSLSDSGSGSSIYYTIDGTTPTTSSPQYTSPLTVSATETIEAIAVAPNYLTSTVASSAYQIEGTPTITDLSLTAGVPGVMVTLEGYNFGSSQGSSTVSYAGSPLTPISWATNAITVTVPSGSTSSNFVVTVAGLASNSAGFTVVEPTSGFERAITISHTQVPNTDQTNFPILISGTYPYLATVANGGRVMSADGYDIVFTSDAAGQDLLNFEIDTYNGATGQAAFWVQIPTLSHTSDTSIYMWYGITGITASQENKTGVWDNNYLGVWHLPNGTALSAADSTANGHNGVDEGAVATAGLIGGAAAFNGNSYIDIGNLGTFPTLGTIEFWMQSPSLSSYPDALSTDYNGDNYGIRFEEDSSGDFSVAIGNAAFSFNGYGYMTGSMQPNSWYHVVLTWNTADSSATGYLNGVQVFTTNSNSLWPSDIPDLSIGSGFNSSRDWNGIIDETRFSQTARSADWIATEYNNESSPTTFYTVGQEVAPQ